MSPEVRAVPNGILVFLEGTCVAGIGHNYYRPWLYPLYTPAGRPVLQEFPFDHPFHTGCFVAQHPVRCNGGEANFWAMPPQREPNDPIFVHVGRVEVQSFVFPVMRCVWRDERGQPVLDEERSFSFSIEENTTVCDIASRKIASYGDVEFPATKFGGIGVRVDPGLLPVAGGRIAGRHDAASEFIAYDGLRHGLRLSVTDRSRFPWFVRDYGLALYNPTWKQPLELKKGEAWEIGLRLAAYDVASR